MSKDKLTTQSAREKFKTLDELVNITTEVKRQGG